MLEFLLKKANIGGPRNAPSTSRNAQPVQHKYHTGKPATQAPSAASGMESFADAKTAIANAASNSARNYIRKQVYGSSSVEPAPVSAPNGTTPGGSAPSGTAPDAYNPPPAVASVNNPALAQISAPAINTPAPADASVNAPSLAAPRRIAEFGKM